jgi:Putative peptidoglycan binding domain
MAKRLTAQRFADVPELEASLNDTTDTHVISDGGGVLPRSNGPHVKRLQESLLAMGFDLPQFGADGDFGTETKVAVAAFQIEAGVERRPDLPDRTELIDGKVGRDTMYLFDTFDPGPTSGSFTSISTSVFANSATFRLESHRGGPTGRGANHDGCRNFHLPHHGKPPSPRGVPGLLEEGCPGLPSP